MVTPSNESQDATASGISLAHLGIAGTTSDCQSKELLKRKINLAMKRVASEEDTTVTEEELVRLIRVWEPQRDILCLYVRWARQLRRNFNLDSIATLLCLSRQCQYTPVDFLCKVKTLSVLKNDKSCFGVSFQFDIPTRKDLDREKLNKEFVGLSVTFALLQEQVNHSSSILGKTGMRQSSSTPRVANPVRIAMDHDHTTDVMSHPTIEFHTQSSLMNRIWVCLSHRWLALYTAEHLFREANATWSYQESLVYSFQSMASCGPGRFEFLSPLVGYCLRFHSEESINSQRVQLREIWSDPSSFVPYGQSCLGQFSTDAQIRIITTCFQDLRSEIPANCKKQISYNRDASWTRRWLMLRSYIFHFWLESTANNNIKSIVTNSDSASQGRRTKRKCLEENELQIPPLSNHVHSPARHLTVTTMPYKNPRTTSNNKVSVNGLQSIISSRSPQKTSKQAVSVGATEENKETRASTLNDSDSKNQRTTSRLLDKDFDWTTFRSATQEEMQRHVQSYLLIHRLDGTDMLFRAFPIGSIFCGPIARLDALSCDSYVSLFPSKKKDWAGCDAYSSRCRLLR